MAKPRKKAAPKVPQTTLGKALDFVKLAQIDKLDDLLYRSHCRLAQGYVVAFDGVLAMGHPIDDDLTVCPQTFRLMDALKRCKQTLSITQLDSDRLVIKSGGYRAVIPCLNPAALPYSTPDVQVGIIDNTIRDGFAVLNPIVTGAGETTVQASLLLQNSSMVATDRQIMLEYWHGLELPDNLAIPKPAIIAVCKIGLDLVGIGVSDTTVTFHYEGGAWLRTQLYAEKWPDVAKVLAGGDSYVATEVPPALFDAVDAVSDFSKDTIGNGAIYTQDGKLSSHKDEGVGATYEIEGVTAGLCFSAKHLKAMKGVATAVDLVGKNGITYFYGDRVRGAISQRRE